MFLQIAAVLCEFFSEFFFFFLLHFVLLASCLPSPKPLSCSGVSYKGVIVSGFVMRSIWGDVCALCEAGQDTRFPWVSDGLGTVL